MATSFRYSGTAANGVAYPAEISSPRKRWAPPGYEVSTTITSRGYQPVEHRYAHNSKCQNHRQRYPEVEAIVQMFFRFCAIVFNVSILIIVCILDSDLENLMAVKRLYGAVGYSFLLNTLEFISLSNPQPTLLLYLFPWLFPATKSKSSHELQPRFPRLPSLFLAICEVAALAGSCWRAFLFLNPIVLDDSERGGCPAATCVTPEERHMIYGYILEVVEGLLHVGFFLMAAVHWTKRKGPGWMEAWGV